MLLTPVTITEQAKPYSLPVAQPPNVAPYAGSSLQLIGTAEGKLSGALELVRDALRLDRYALVPDRARHNERVDDKLAIAERRLFEALDAVLKARAAVAPAEEA